MKPSFQLVFIIITILMLVTGIIMIPASLFTGTLDFIDALMFFILGIILTISMSTAAAISNLLSAFSMILKKVNEKIEELNASNLPPDMSHNAPPYIHVRGIHVEDLKDMPDDHPLKQIISSFETINSKQGKRSIADMTLEELKEELKIEEADEKQDFEKCIILRDEIAKREQKGDL